MIKFGELKKDNILGESQYYKVVKKSTNSVTLSIEGQEVEIGKEYIEKYLDSADQFNTTEKHTKTQLADLFVSNPRIVMTVAFIKQDKPKTKKAYKADLEVQAAKVKEEFLAKGVSAIEEALANPVLFYIPGELRIMRGRHYGELNDMGRINFVDMDVTDSNIRQVDPRTIQYLIINNTKYILK